jgi:hypothetical protein
MLLLGFREIDGLAGEESQFAMDDAGADGAGYGGEHGGKVYMKVFAARACPATAAACYIARREGGEFARCRNFPLGIMGV